MKNHNLKDAYNQAAEAYRKKYDALSARTEDVDVAFSYYTANHKPRVLEIGCAYGRDAQYILKNTDDYIGIDISEAYIAMAREENVRGIFEVADVLEYDFPKSIDIVFSFASLLHLSSDDIALVLQRSHTALNEQGLIFISLKRRDTYETDVVDDGISVRRFYYYNREKIHEIMGDQYEEVFYEEQMLKEPWFTIIFKKKSL